MQKIWARRASRAAIIALCGLGAQTCWAEAVVPVERRTDSVTSTFAEPAPSPEASAFRAALTIASSDLPDAERTAIDQFFAERDYAPFWTAKGSARVAALLAAIGDSAAHGLPETRYGGGELAVLFDPASRDVSDVEREIAGMQHYLRFARDLSSGALVPSSVDSEIDISPPRPTPATLLSELAGASVSEALASLEPSDPDYRTLMHQKARLTGLLQSDGWGATVPEGPAMRAGESGPRVAPLRNRLARLGYGAPAAEGEPNAFDDGLARLVKEFQRDHGLNADGVVGRRTLTEINTGAETRLQQVLANLERLRWMNRDKGKRYIVANIPDYSVRLVRDGEIIWESRSVVGEPYKTRTPEFSDEMSYLVVNPTWHMPASIAGRDYLPKLKSDPAVLGRNGMRLVTRNGTEINPQLIDFSQFSKSNFPFRIKQRPSSANALGRVKFMFPNQFAIYLHDTPSRSLFSKDARAFSNGCIRLERPYELAHLLLEDQLSDPEATFSAWMAAKSERHVNLERPVPVHLIYRTAIVDDDGEVRYRNDVYGRDAKVYLALKAAGFVALAAQG